MTVDSASEWHTEVAFYPTSDLYEIMTIAMLANIIGLRSVDICKVSVNFVYRPLTGEICNDKSQAEETRVDANEQQGLQGFIWQDGRPAN